MTNLTSIPKLPKLRDSFRQRTYDAEQAALPQLSVYKKNFTTLKHCQQFVNEMVTSSIWQSLKEPETVQVKAMRRIGRRSKRRRIARRKSGGLRRLLGVLRKSQNFKNLKNESHIRTKTTGLTRYKKDPLTSEIVFDHIALAPPEPENNIIGGWDSLTILHELAHVVNPYGEKHGAAFRAAHIKLMQAAYGDTAAAHLASAYVDEKLMITNDTLFATPLTDG